MSNIYMAILTKSNIKTITKKVEEKPKQEKVKSTK